MTTVVEFYVSEKERKKVYKELLNHFDGKTSTNIEQGIYDYTDQFCKSDNKNLHMAQSIYKCVAQNLIYNCEQNSDTIRKLKKRIVKKKFNPYNLAFLRPDELDEDAWIRIILRKNTTEDKLKNFPTIEWKPCRVCKCTEFLYVQLQTRSADEPMTTFYICKKCDKTYKMNN